MSDDSLSLISVDDALPRRQLLIHSSFIGAISHPCLLFAHSTAGRMVKTGLIAADIVSKWTWAATLLQSSNVAWNYGVSGPFW